MKIYVVEACYDCPLICKNDEIDGEGDWYECSHVDNKNVMRIPDINKIPEWCPLEDFKGVCE